MAIAEAELTGTIKRILAYTGKDLDLITDHGLHATEIRGAKGVTFQVRLTSYRALPLSCIEAIRLSIDDEPVDIDSVTLILNGYEHRVADLKHLSRLWWFILDLATIFVPLPKGLAGGAHVVAGTLVTVEPYVTAGRFSFHNSSARTLILDESIPAEVMS